MLRSPARGRIPFSLVVQVGGDTGELTGEATQTSATTAEYRTTDCQLTFVLGGAGLEVSQRQDCGLGLAADAGGRYVRSAKPLASPPTPRYPLTAAGLLPNNEAEDLLRTSRYYAKLYTRLGQAIGKPDNCTSPDWARQAAVPGILLAGMVVVQPQRVQAAVVDYDENHDEVIYYFDSTGEGISAMPACISAWCKYYQNQGIPVQPEQ